MEEDYSDQGMIALLPVTSSWCRIEKPHLTLAYIGEIDNFSPTTFNEVAKDASMIATLLRPLTLSVRGVEVFGETDKVDVLRFQPHSDLDAVRHHLEHWDDGKYPDYKPHATIGPVGSSMLVPIPEFVMFDRICVSWGEDDLVFWLKMPGGMHSDLN